MKRKTLINELEDILNEVEVETLKELDEDFKEKANKENDTMIQLAFTMQNVLAIATFRKKLFDKLK
mgnify:CR=1 FL=1